MSSNYPLEARFRRMNVFAIDIKVGSVGARVIHPSRLEFHKEVTRMLFPGPETIERLGMEYSSSIDYFRYVHNPGCIKDIVQEAVNGILKSGQKIGLCITDFTDNPFIAVREPLLLALFNSIMMLCKSTSCNSFAVLLPELPGSESASAKYLKDFSQELENEDYTVILIANSGESDVKSSMGFVLPDIMNTYAQAIIRLYGVPSAKLERKCVRRLGHFVSYYPRENKTICRQYSYLLYDCGDELRELFENWWHDYGDKKYCILFDLKNNEPFRRAIQAFGDSHSVLVARIVDVLEKADLRQKVSNLSGCILVLDAVDRGTTLAAYAEELQTIGIPVSSNVVVAINKTGAKQSKIGEFSIHGFLARQRGVVLMPCVQCKLGLPHTPESHESLVPIRSFDMLHMAHESGYEAEPLPEVPDGRLQYQVLPDFLKMLDQFGDWIAYKFDCLLRALNCPDDLCIIHPDESQSMAVIDKIQKLLGNKYCVVKISRELISEAQANGNSWQLVFDKHPRVPLIHDLESVSNSTGLILDIFWGSGSTCVSLEALLRDFNIVPFAYLCLVDFDPRAGNSTGSGLPKYSLYQWDNPRNLLKVGG